MGQHQTEPDPDHIHKWTLDPPRGEFSTGRCECGAEQEFSNYGIPEGKKSWNQMPTKGRISKEVMDRYHERIEAAFGHLSTDPDGHG